MKRLAFLVLFLASCAYSQYSTTISGGLALGFEKCNTKPGPFFSIQTGVEINKYFQIGGHVEYSWLTRDNIFKDYYNFDKAGFHIFDIGVVHELCIPANEDVSFSLEVDPAFTLLIAYAKHALIGPTSYTKPGFMLTYGVGMSIKRFYMAYKIKSPFVKDNYGDRFELDMMSFSVGFKING